jgi:hypothetical protein
VMRCTEAYYRSLLVKLISEAYSARLSYRCEYFSSINPAIGALRSTIVVVLTIRVLNS